MNQQSLIKELHIEADTKIVLLVADGLGGLPRSSDGKTELEAAKTPHLDALAQRGTTGLIHPIMRGVTCGSGPGHLSLFGYDPLEHRVGRGVLSALGVEFDLRAGDVAARGNFCSMDDDGNVTDRRAGRIADDEGQRLVKKLQAIEIEDVEVFVRHVKQYRFALILRGEGLSAELNDSDPRVEGQTPHEVQGRDKRSKRTAEPIGTFVQQAREILHDESPANMILLRGFATRPNISSMKQCYGVNACGIAIYPMYRGLSRLLEMHVPEKPADLNEQMEQLESCWDEHDFFFVHHKDTDSSGEDGDFDRKVAEIERLDACIEMINGLQPDVLVVTGDHSTPAGLRNHSWHPVPVVLTSQTCRPDKVEIFGEREVITGGLGQFPAKELMPLMLGHAKRLDKFGA